MLNLFVLDYASNKKIPAIVKNATEQDLAATKDWQTEWTTPYVRQLPNKVALHRADNDELLGLMSYDLDEAGLVVEILYLENARHSNANLLRVEGGQKKYIGIAKALFAYAVQVSLDAGFDGILIFKAKTSELLNYYMEKFGARQVASYDPFRLVIWEDAAVDILSDFIMEVSDDGPEDKEYFAYLRQVSKRYNINLSKANRLEYDFVTRVAESEFYLQRANA